MMRAPTRTHFHSSRLVRVLTDLAVVEARAPAGDFAEQLGRWVKFTDAIALSAVHSTRPPEMASGAQSTGRVKLSETYARTRASLVRSITQSGLYGGGRARMEQTPTEAGADQDDTITFEPYRLRYLTQQRDIELKVRSLRAHVREVLGQSSPALKKLAALDAAFENILSERESKLLSTIPALLEKRFHHLRRSHQQPLADPPQADHTAAPLQPAGWLAGFGEEMQTVLLAELDVRLQPTLGLIEACNLNSTTA
jgi:Protein of unknown function (DUF3348)